MNKLIIFYKNKTKFQQILLITIVIAIITLVSSAIYTISTNQTQQDKTSDNYETSETNSEFVKLLNDVQSKLASGDSTSAVEIIDKSIDSETDSSNKAQILVFKASTLYNLKKFQAAYDSLLIAENLNSSASSAELAGDCLIEMFRYSEALAFFNKALSHITGNTEMDGIDRNSIRNKIKIAEAKI